MDDSGSSDGLLQPFRNQSMGEGLHSRWPSERKGSSSSDEFAEALQQMYQRCEDLHCAVARRPEGRAHTCCLRMLLLCENNYNLV